MKMWYCLKNVLDDTWWRKCENLETDPVGNKKCMIYEEINRFLTQLVQMQQLNLN